MKAVYIGAGIDIRPIKFLKHIKLFYYIDGLPFSNFGILQSNIIMKNGMDGYSNPRFISELDKNMTSINMKLINILDNIRIYSDGDQTVYYYTNTSIPEHYKKIKDAIGSGSRKRPENKEAYDNAVKEKNDWMLDRWKKQEEENKLQD